MILAIYALLPSLTAETFTRFLRLLQDYALGIGEVFNYPSVLIDLESPGLPTVSAISPATSISGCFFRFNQSFYQKLKSLELEESYIDRS